MRKYNVDFVPEGTILTFIKLTQNAYHKEGEPRVYGKGLYKCSCGRDVELIVHNVYRGKTKSCGCLWGRWTPEQDKILIENFPDLHKVSIMANKTVSASMGRAKLLKIFHAPKIDIWYMNIPIEIRSYLAGHFDGEGCATFRKRGKVRTPEIRLSVCSKTVLELYKKYFNGNGIYLESKGVNKPIYKWNCVGYEDIYNFILSVEPFSIEKKEQLMCLKEYIDLYISNGKKSGLSKDFKNFSLVLHSKCTELKKTA